MSELRYTEAFSDVHGSEFSMSIPVTNGQRIRAARIASLSFARQASVGFDFQLSEGISLRGADATMQVGERTYAVPPCSNRITAAAADTTEGVLRLTLEHPCGMQGTNTGGCYVLWSLSPCVPLSTFTFAAAPVATDKQLTLHLPAWGLPLTTIGDEGGFGYIVCPPQDPRDLCALLSVQQDEAHAFNFDGATAITTMTPLVAPTGLLATKLGLYGAAQGMPVVLPDGIYTDLRAVSASYQQQALMGMGVPPNAATSVYNLALLTLNGATYPVYIDCVRASTVAELAQAVDAGLTSAAASTGAPLLDVRARADGLQLVIESTALLPSPFSLAFAQLSMNGVTVDARGLAVALGFPYGASLSGSTSYTSTPPRAAGSLNYTVDFDPPSRHYTVSASPASLPFQADTVGANVTAGTAVGSLRDRHRGTTSTLALAAGDVLLARRSAAGTPQHPYGGTLALGGSPLTLNGVVRPTLYLVAGFAYTLTADGAPLTVAGAALGADGTWTPTEAGSYTYSSAADSRGGVLEVVHQPATELWVVAAVDGATVTAHTPLTSSLAAADPSFFVSRWMPNGFALVGSPQLCSEFGYSSALERLAWRAESVRQPLEHFHTLVSARLYLNNTEVENETAVLRTNGLLTYPMAALPLGGAHLDGFSFTFSDWVGTNQTTRDTTLPARVELYTADGEPFLLDASSVVVSLAFKFGQTAEAGPTL